MKTDHQFEELSHDAKVMLFAIGILNDLRDKGLVAGGIDLSEHGQRNFELLKASGFQPSEMELKGAVAHLCSDDFIRESLSDT